MTVNHLINKKAIQIANNMRAVFDKQEVKKTPNVKSIELELLKFFKAQNFYIEDKSIKTSATINYNNPETFIFNDSFSENIVAFSDHEMMLFTTRLVQFKEKSLPQNKKLEVASVSSRIDSLSPITIISEDKSNSSRINNPRSNDREILGFFTKRVTEESRSVSNWYSSDINKVNEEVYHRQYASSEIPRKSKLDHIDTRSNGIHEKHLYRSGTHINDIRRNSREDALFTKLVQISKNISSSKGNLGH